MNAKAAQSLTRGFQHQVPTAIQNMGNTGFSKDGFSLDSSEMMTFNGPFLKSTLNQNNNNPQSQNR